MQKDSLFSLAQQSLLAPHALDTGHLQQVFGQMLAHRVDYADLYFQYTRSEGWSLEEGIVKIGQLQHRPGRGRACGGAAKRPPSPTPTTSAWPRWQSAARATRAIAAARRAPQQGADAAAAAGSQHALSAASIPLPRSTRRTRWRCWNGWKSYARAQDPRVTQVMAGLAGEYDVVLVARSDGLHGGRRAPAGARVASR